jgi:hypothetical protein
LAGVAAEVLLAPVLAAEVLVVLAVHLVASLSRRWV